MTYLFLRQFNLAYDFFLEKYFKEGGIEFDEDSTYPDAARRVAFASGKAMSPNETLFSAYVSNWGLHPEVRPSYLELFEKTVEGSRDPKRLRELEKELPSGRRKIVFSLEDVSSAIFDFYRRQIGRGVERALREHLPESEIIISFFTYEEIKAVPSRTNENTEAWKASVREAACKLQSVVSSLTPAIVRSDIELVLSDHEAKDASHVKAGEKSTGGQKVWHCNHLSDWVELSCFGEKENQLTLYLEPRRGLSNTVYEAGGDWNYIGFPSFMVLVDG